MEMQLATHNNISYLKDCNSASRCPMDPCIVEIPYRLDLREARLVPASSCFKQNAESLWYRFQSSSCHGWISLLKVRYLGSKLCSCRKHAQTENSPDDQIRFLKYYTFLGATEMSSDIFQHSGEFNLEHRNTEAGRTLAAEPQQGLQGGETGKCKLFPTAIDPISRQWVLHAIVHNSVFAAHIKNPEPTLVSG